jgi:hypothetical protein
MIRIILPASASPPCRRRRLAPANCLSEKAGDRPNFWAMALLTEWNSEPTDGYVELPVCLQPLRIGTTERRFQIAVFERGFHSVDRLGA